MPAGSIDFPSDFRQAAVAVLDEFAEKVEAWGKYTISRGRSLLHGERREPIAQPDSIKLDNEMLVRFKYLMELGTPWAILKACWELYTDGLVVAVLGAFRDFLRIVPPTIADPIALAEFMAKETGRSIKEKIPYWLECVCDKTEPGRLNWNPGNLPQLIRMMAFADLPGSPDWEAQCWELLGGDLSRKIVQVLITEFFGKLDAGIEGAARSARIEARASRTRNARDLVQPNRAALKLLLWPTTSSPMVGESQERPGVPSAPIPEPAALTQPQEAAAATEQATQTPSDIRAHHGTGIHATSDGRFSASSDFRSVKFDGNEYILTTNRSRQMGILWEAWRSGHPAVPKHKLLAGGRDMSDSWRDCGLWKTLIVSRARGTYQLDLPA